MVCGRGISRSADAMATVEMLTVVLVITLAAGTPLAQTFRVPNLTMPQCHALENAPGTWWTLRGDAETKCETEFRT